MKISFGRYYDAKSIIHSMDPRVKIFGTLLFIVLTFIVSNLFTLTLIVFPLLIAYIVATKRPLSILKMFKTPIIIGVFLFLVNCFVFNYDFDKNIVGDLENKYIIYFNNETFNFIISYEMIMETLKIAYRIFIIILTVTLLTLSTKPVLLTKAIEWYLYPLKFIKIPYQIISMIISIALRFLPTLIDEASRIFKAQSSRGVDFYNGGLKTKSKATITLIVPLFVSSFNKADELSNSLEIRGYDPYKKRTSYHKWSFSWMDWSALFCSIALFIIIIMITVEPSWFSLPLWWIENAKANFI